MDWYSNTSKEKTILDENILHMSFLRLGTKYLQICLEIRRQIRRQQKQHSAPELASNVLSVHVHSDSIYPTIRPTDIYPIPAALYVSYVYIYNIYIYIISYMYIYVPLLTYRSDLLYPYPISSIDRKHPAMGWKENASFRKATVPTRC